jgi:hypothetical protein
MVKPTIKEFTATGSIAGLSAKNVVGKFPVDEHPVENNSVVKAGVSNGLAHAPNQPVGSSQLQVGGDQSQPKANARFSTYEAEKKDTQSQETKDVY